MDFVSIYCDGVTMFAQNVPRYIVSGTTEPHCCNIACLSNCYVSIYYQFMECVSIISISIIIIRFVDDRVLNGGCKHLGTARLSLGHSSSSLGNHHHHHHHHHCRHHHHHRVYLKAVSCKFQNLQIIRTICKCEVMM